jgi:hypothetical protein
MWLVVRGCYHVRTLKWKLPEIYCLIYGEKMELINIYFFRPILLFANTDVSTTKMYLDTSTLAKNIMGRREYQFFPGAQDGT